MDRLHVATLNIRNLADRWFERLPLLLADMAALQPDLLGLQEVVYVMQQDRLLGAAGEGRYGVVRGWAGRPEYGNSLLVREPLAATGTDRLDLGPEPVGAAGDRRACRAGRPCSSSSPTSTTWAPDEAQRDEQIAAILPWLDGGPRCRRDDPDGRLQRRSRGTRPGADARRRVPLRLRRGQRRRARGDLAVRAPGTGDGHRRRPGVPRLHLGPRARSGSTSARLVFDRPAPEDPTLYPSDHLGIATVLEIG